MGGLAALVAAFAAAMAWSSGVEAAEARIGDYVFGCEAPDGESLKPKLGDVEGVFYTDLPAQQEQCRETIKRKIALCRENTGFVSNTKNWEFATCLAIFEEQARACVAFFEAESVKCAVGGAAAAVAATEMQPAPDAVSGDHYEAAEARIGNFEFGCEAPDGERLKPKLGDVEGVFYTDLPAQQEQCRETIKRKIALCRENTGFVSNTKNWEYAACLPIFEEQARACAAFFQAEGAKCAAGARAAAAESESQWASDAAPADPNAAAWDTNDSDSWEGYEASPVLLPTGNGGDRQEIARGGADGIDEKYSAAVQALDGKDGVVLWALPEDDYTAKLTALERQEAERRATAEAQEAERRAELLRKEIADQRTRDRLAQREAEQARQRAALERESAAAWKRELGSGDEGGSGTSLFGGGGAAEQAFQETLQQIMDFNRQRELERQAYERQQPAGQNQDSSTCETVIIGTQYGNVGYRPCE